ncbi:GNAT family N-acetyltransferase [Microvirga sp. W0021]|uniref:GNAT family N-acetyltransferase n=1 Tax=Hohaiivirga grylli TaxID=3133970 RepID=A0ABV0BJ58_9HYPH
MPGSWRLMRNSDMQDVSRIAAIVHPDFPEDDAIFAERLELAPEGCFILELEGEACGYMFSHPWLDSDIPPLNTLLGKLPASPQTWYLHDIALMPQARSRGQTSPIIRHLFSIGQAADLPTVSLVAVNGSQGFWQHMGFEDVSSEKLKEKLLSYDDAARYMVHR